MTLEGKSKSRFHVVVTGPQLAEQAVALMSQTCSIEFTEAYVESQKLIDKLQKEKADALLVRMGNITADVIQASPKMKVIAKHGSGVDNIDITAASKLDIPVMIASSANYEAVAEHTLALILSVAKDIPWLDSRVRQGCWDKSNYRGRELYNKTLGLVGFGRIGRRVKELVAPFKMKTLAYDPLIPVEKLPSDVMRVEKLEVLLESADIVSLHCPLVDSTKHLIGKEELKIMKETAWLINTARGAVVDENALIEALKRGEIAAAGLDTFEKEPPENIDRFTTAGKTILTPHIAGITEESFERMGMEAARNILNVLEKRTLDSECVVNWEEIQG